MESHRRIHHEASAEHPSIDVFLPLAAAVAPRAALVVFPGGGYRTVATEKEGGTLARTLLAERARRDVDDLVIFVVTYRVGGTYLRPTSHPIEPAIDDADAAIAFVRAAATDGDERFGPIDVHRIGVCGFSAGGNLALCLVAREGGVTAESRAVATAPRAVSAVDSEEALAMAVTAVAHTVAESALAAAASTLTRLAYEAQRDTVSHVDHIDARRASAPPVAPATAAARAHRSESRTFPPIAALLLFYPTLRSPSCACIAGGVFVPSSLGAWSGGSYGEHWPLTASNGQHAYCWASGAALRRLLPALPRPLCVVTARGDMLLPTGKHGGKLIAAVAAHRGVAALVDDGDVECKNV